MALHRVAVDLRPHVPRPGRPARRRPHRAASGRPSRSSRRIRSAPHARRSGTATEIYDYLRLLYAKIGRVHCPACGAPAVSHSPESIVSALLDAHAGRPRADHLSARRSRPGLPPAELWAGLTRRGFARVPDRRRASSTSPRAAGRVRRPEAIAVVLDRVVLEAAHRAPPRRVGRVRAARGRRPGRGGDRRRADPGLRRRRSAAARAASRSSGRSRCSSRSTIRSAPARSARASATCSSTTRRSWCPTARSSLADGAVEPWTHPSGQVVPARAAEGGPPPRARHRHALGGAPGERARVRLRRRREVPGHPRLLRGGRVVPLQAPRPRLPLALSQPVALSGLPRRSAQAGRARRPRRRPDDRRVFRASRSTRPPGC